MKFETKHVNEKNITVDQVNQKAWNHNAYEAWINRFGTPAIAAEKIKQNPQKTISHLYTFMGDVRGKRIMNLMGSNGTKAVALAWLGADVSVIDFSVENQKYAMELACELGVNLNYIVSDVLKLSDDILCGNFDIVFAEMGILHYFEDLAPFFSVISRLLKPGGQLILRDFHPVSTKLISSRGSTANVRKHKVTGDYFSTELVEKNVSYSKFNEDEDENAQESEKVFLRLWTLGEIITTIADADLCIQRLDEEPNLSSDNFDKGIPKTFTLTARKISK